MLGGSLLTFRPVFLFQKISTRYFPGLGPRSAATVYLPSTIGAPARNWASWPPPSGRKAIAPLSTGWPSNVTLPCTGERVVTPALQPAIATRARADASARLR